MMFVAFLQYDSTSSSNLGYGVDLDVNLISIILAFLGIVISFIAIIIAIRHQKKQTVFLKDLQSIEVEIKAQVSTLADANRRTIETLPELFVEIKELLNTAESNKDTAKLSIISVTPVFGLIHSYNPKFSRYFMDDYLPQKIQSKYSNDLSKYDSNSKAITVFNREVKDLQLCLKTCAKVMPKGQLRMIYRNTSSTGILKFISDYFKVENSSKDIAAGHGLVYPEIDMNSEGNFTAISEIRGKECERLIREKIKTAHGNAIRDLIESRNELENEAMFLDKQPNTPIQFFLLEYGPDHKRSYLSIILNAHDFSSSYDQERVLDAVVSKEHSLYLVFNDLFEALFKKNNKKKN